MLAADDLHPWAHWITPEVEPRRYDTHFFVARMPADQQARDISGETDDAAWWSPDAALQAERSGAMALMPPTLSIMLELADHASVAEVLAAAENRVIECVLPALVADRGRLAVQLSESGGGAVMSDVVTRLAPYVALVRAANPGPMTLDGTNTWILGDPSRGAPVVVDPGPLIAEHLRRDHGPGRRPDRRDPPHPSPS